MLDDIATILDVNNGASRILKPLIGFSLFVLEKIRRRARLNGNRKSILLFSGMGILNLNILARRLIVVSCSHCDGFSREGTVNVPCWTVYVPLFLESVE